MRTLAAFFFFEIWKADFKIYWKCKPSKRIELGEFYHHVSRKSNQDSVLLVNELKYAIGMK